MVKNRCNFCKNEFETKNPNRHFCYGVKCRVSMDFLMRRKKGQDPVKYYKDKINQGAEEICWVCEQKFKLRSIYEFFAKMCGNRRYDLMKEKEGMFLKEFMENPRSFLDKVKIGEKRKKK